MDIAFDPTMSLEHTLWLLEGRTVTQLLPSVYNSTCHHPCMHIDLNSLEIPFVSTESIPAVTKNRVMELESDNR